jgi:hypothetical protein
MDPSVYKYIFVPAVAIIGIYVAGNLIQSTIGIPYATQLLFGAAGGIGLIAAFYKHR